MTAAAGNATGHALGRIGVWLPLHLPSHGWAERSRLARLVERLGYGSLWSGEIPGSGVDAFTVRHTLLSATETVVVGAGIAHLGARPPEATACRESEFATRFPGRSVLGLGGHGAAGQDGDPVSRVRAYLDAIDTADRASEHGSAERGAPDRVRVLAALGPRMLALAAERTDGALPFLAPLAHTGYARDRLGSGKLLLPVQATMLTDDRDQVRAAVLAMFGGEPGRFRGSGYHANLRRFGFGEREIDRLDDRLLDALVAWGDENAVAASVDAQLNAGASSVLIHPIPTDETDVPTQLDRLAPVLLG